MDETLTENEKLLEFALDGKHNYMGYLTCPEDAKIARMLRSANKKVAKGFGKSADIILEKYSEGELGSEAPEEILTVYRALRRAKRFYEEEASIADDRLNEWLAYVTSGHLLDTYLFWRVRPEEDRYDHRFPLLRIR